MNDVRARVASGLDSVVSGCDWCTIIRVVHFASNNTSTAHSLGLLRLTYFAVANVSSRNPPTHKATAHLPPMLLVYMPVVLSSCRLALIYVVISLSLVISHAKAIEPQLLRPQRDVEHIKVNVRENLVELYENEEVDVSCRARGGDKIKETPIITFYVSV